VKGLRIDSLLAMYDQVSGMDIQGFYNGIRSLEEQFPTFRRDVEKAAVEGFISKCRQLDDFIQENKGMLSEYKIQIEKKADAWLAQLNQEYKKNMLKWTVIIGTVLVLAFNADSFNIFQFLLNDTETRKVISTMASETIVTEQKARAEDLNAIVNAIDAAMDGESLSEVATKITVFLRNIKDDFIDLGATGGVDKTGMLEERINKINTPGKVKMQNFFDETVSLYVELQKTRLAHPLQGIAALDLPLGWGQEGKRWAVAVGPGGMFLYFCSKI